MDLNDVASNAIKLFGEKRTALGRLHLKDRIHGFFGLKDLGREVSAK